jgi:hypothetical protein
MIKSVIKLKHSLNAEAGQLLVLHENGNVYAVNHEALESLICGPAFGMNPQPSKPKKARAHREETYNDSKTAEVDDMLLRGCSHHEIAHKTMVSRNFITARRMLLKQQDVLPKEKEKGSRFHYWFKSPEALASAVARGKRLGEINKAKKGSSK